MAFAAARMIKDKEAKQSAGQQRRAQTESNQAQSVSKYNLQKVKVQWGAPVVEDYKWFSCSHYGAAFWQN